MALNYSHKPIYPARISEDDLVLPMTIVNGYLVEGVPEKSGEGCSWPRCTGRGETEHPEFYFGRDRFSSPEPTTKDIVDLLPTDPFGMDIKTTFTAITGWLEDMEVGYGECIRGNGGGSYQEDYGLFAEWNFIWNDALTFHSLSGNSRWNKKLSNSQTNLCINGELCMGIISPRSGLADNKLNIAGQLNEYNVERDLGDAQAIDGFVCQSACNMGNVVGIQDGSSPSCSSELLSGRKVEDATNYEIVPHEALTYALSYLGVRDLLSVESVCRSLCSTVRGDPLLWRSIHIDQPLNERITDAVLLQLTSRAQGNLQCLTMVECPRITDDGLRPVLESNPRLNKLCVPGCSRLTIEGILNNLKIYNFNKDVKGITHLRIGGIYGVTRELFEELKFLLGADCHKPGSNHKQRFYHRGNYYLPCDDDRAIDIEMCPRCEKIRLVYDCPSEGCQVGGESNLACKACSLCIARCAQCGRCINDTEYEETFCLELLCSDCFHSCLGKKVGSSGILHGQSFDTHACVSG